jgi:hypothetical protein
MHDESDQGSTPGAAAGGAAGNSPPDTPGPSPTDAAGTGEAQCLTGRLERAKVDIGSKSERMALRLALGEGRWVVLRRAGQSPYQDLELESLQGQVLRVEGRMRGSYFLVQHFQVTDDAPPQA